MNGARRILLPALTAVFILSGCSGEDVTGSHPDYPRTWIADGVIVIDDEPGLSLHDISDGCLVLERTGERP